MRPSVFVAWFLIAVGAYNLVAGVVKYDLHPASLIGGGIVLILGLWLLRRSHEGA